MKTIKLLLIALLLTSCSSEDRQEELCECFKETYEYVQGTAIGQNGLPVLTYEKDTLSRETVTCQPEQEETDAGNGVFFNISCND